MSDDAKSRLLKAAGPIFAEKGFERATVREICQAADANVASVNYHFGDKERLYIETVTQARRLRVARVPMPERSPSQSPADMLREFIRVLLTRMTMVDTAPWESRLMLREMLEPTKACEEIAQEHLRPEFEVLVSVLDDLTPEGTPQHKLKQLGFSVVGQCLFYRVGRRVVDSLIEPDMKDGHFTIEELTRHISDTVLAAVGHGPALRGGGHEATQPPAVAQR